MDGTFHDDWFLPLIAELMVLYTNLRRADARDFHEKESLTVFIHRYWSSTEASIYCGGSSENMMCGTQDEQQGGAPSGPDCSDRSVWNAAAVTGPRRLPRAPTSPACR